MQTGTEGTSSDLREQASQVSEAAQQKAVELKHEGGRALAGQVDERTTQIGQQARALAGSLRRSGGELEGQGQSGPAALVATVAAERLERVGGYLEETRGDDLVRDAERFARERPWLVAGAAAVLGFAASRLLKASSERRYQASGNGDYQQASWTSSGQAWESERVGSPMEGTHVPVTATGTPAPGS